MPVSLFKQLLEKVNGTNDNVLEVSSAKSLEKMADKVATSPKLAKGEARSAGFCMLNPFYAIFVEKYLGLKNFENGEATKDALNGLEKIAKAIGGISNREKEHKILGFLNK